MPNECSTDAAKKNNCNPCKNGVSSNENLVLAASALAFSLSRDLSIKELATLTNFTFMTYETLSSILVQRRLDCPTPKEEGPIIPPESIRERPAARPVFKPQKPPREGKNL